jgi:hypothetical protein
MEDPGAIAGPLLALLLVGVVGVRTAILLSIVPGLLADEAGDRGRRCDQAVQIGLTLGC